MYCDTRSRHDGSFVVAELGNQMLLPDSRAAIARGMANLKKAKKLGLVVATGEDALRRGRVQSGGF